MVISESLSENSLQTEEIRYSGKNEGRGDTPNDRRTEGLDDVFGDFITTKKTGRLRIGFQNFSGFTNNKYDPVDESLRQWVTNQEFDIFGISETNLYWPNVKKELQLWEGAEGWWNPQQTRMSIAYNNQDKTFGHSKTRQYRGWHKSA